MGYLLAHFALGWQQGEQKVGYTDTPFIPGTKWRVHDGDRPQPVVVQAPEGAPPSDAIALFEAAGLSAWKGKNGPAEWTLDRSLFTVKRGAGNIETKQHFGSCQLHLEFRTREGVTTRDQGRSNSGIFFMGRYEIQILDNFQNKTYADGTVGAVYGQTPPLVNPSRPAGSWQEYDIVFEAPKFDGQKLIAPAYATVFLNGVLVQNRTEFMGATVWRALPKYEPHPETGPIVLQDHGDAVSFRNIWVRNL
jgi:hypothetical protein